MNLIIVFFSFLLLFLLIYFLLFISHLGEVNIPLLNRLIKKGYLKAKFRARDDLKVLEKIKNRKAFVNRGAKIRIYFNKFQLNLFYYLALLFKSPCRSFVLINHDGEEKKYQKKQYLEHLTKKRRTSVISLFIVSFLILGSLTMVIVISFLFSDPLFIRAQESPVVHDSEEDWTLGTHNNTVVATTTEYLELDFGYLPYTATHASGTDFVGVDKNNLNISTTTDDFKINKHNFAFDEDGGVEIPSSGVATTSDSVGIDAVTDGVDGAFLTQFKETDAGRDLRIWRVNNSGQEVWSSYKTVASSTLEDSASLPASASRETKIISDNNDGAIIIWNSDNRNGQLDIYAQRIDSSGNFLWGSGGVAIATATNSDQHFVNISVTIDDYGDPVVLYQRKISGGDLQAEVARFSLANGSNMWGSPVVLNKGDNYSFSENCGTTILSDNNGGSIAFWVNGLSLLGQRISSSSAVLWTAGGESLADEGVDDYGPTFKFAATSLNENEFLAAHRSPENSDGIEVYAQKIDLEGTKYWGNKGITAFDGDDIDGIDKIVFSAISDNENGIILMAQHNDDPSYITARRFDNSGSLIWDSLINDDSYDARWYNNDDNPSIVEYNKKRNVAYRDNNGDIAVLWHAGFSKTGQVYAQKVDKDDGSLSWADKILINNSRKQTYYPLAVTTSDGALAFYVESSVFGRTSDGYPQNIRVQKIADTQGYYWPADLTSKWIDADSTIDWDSLTTEENVPFDSSITWQTRTTAYPNLALAGTATSSDDWGGDVPLVNNDSHEVRGNFWDVVLSYASGIDDVSTSSPKSMEIHLAEAAEVGYTVVRSPDMTSPGSYAVQTWDGSNWVTQAQITGNTATTSIAEFTPIETDKVRFYFTKGSSQTDTGKKTAISELEIYKGAPSSWQDLDGDSIQSPNRQYLQYRAILSPSSDYADTPSVSSVTASGTTNQLSYCSSGIYTSPVLDSGDASTTWDSISVDFELSTSSSISISERSGDSASPDTTWTSWEEVASSSRMASSNLSPAGTATASSEIDPELLESGGLAYLLGTAEAGIDEDEDTAWMTGENTSYNGGTDQWLEVDLGEEQSVGYVTVSSMDNPNNPDSGYDFAPRDYTIQTWDSASSTWVIQDTVTDNTNYSTPVPSEFSPVTTDKVRIVISKGNPNLIDQVGYDLAGVTEFRIYESDPAGEVLLGATSTTANLATTTAQYFQYKIDLTNPNTLYTPIVSKVQVEYTDSGQDEATTTEEEEATTTEEEEATTTEEEDVESSAPPPPSPPSEPVVQDPETGEDVTVDFSVSVAPPADFSGDVPVVTSTSVNLELEGGPDAVNMAISEDPEFSLASLIPYSESYQFDLSSELGTKTIYAKFYTDRGVSSEVVSCQLKLESAQTETREEEPIVEPSPEEEPDEEEEIVEEPVLEEEQSEEEPVVEPSPEEEPDEEEEVVEEPVLEEEEVAEEEEEGAQQEKEPTSEGSVEEPEEEEITKEGGEEDSEAGSVWEREERLKADSGDEREAEESFVAQTFGTLDKMMISPVKKLAKNIAESQAVQTAQKVAKTKATEATTKSVTGAYIVFSLIQLGAKAGSLNTASYMIINMLGLFTFQRNRNYQIGTVYDSKTGQPVPYAKVEVLDKKGKVKESKITDKFGGYFFLVPPGEYSLMTHRSGYKTVRRPDTVYKTIHTPGKFMVFNKEGIINVDIPLKQEEKSKLSAFLERINLDKILEVVFWVGLITIIVVTILNPTTWNYAMTVSFVILGALKYANYIRPKWGMVMDHNGQGMGFTIIEAQEQANGSLVARTVSDENGRYALILNPGKYQLNVLGPSIKKQTKKINQEKREIFAKKIKVKK